MHSCSEIRDARKRLRKWISNIPSACLVVSASLGEGTEGREGGGKGRGRGRGREGEGEGEREVKGAVYTPSGPWEVLRSPYPERSAARFRLAVSLHCTCGDARL